MKIHDEGLLLHIDFVRDWLKRDVCGDYYGFVNWCITLRNASKTEHDKNRYRMWRLICLLLFDENSHNAKPADVVKWKRIIRAYYRYLHS